MVTLQKLYQDDCENRQECSYSSPTRITILPSFSSSESMSELKTPYIQNDIRVDMRYLNDNQWVLNFTHIPMMCIASIYEVLDDYCALVLNFSFHLCGRNKSWLMVCGTWRLGWSENIPTSTISRNKFRSAGAIEHSLNERIKKHPITLPSTTGAPSYGSKTSVTSF